MRIAAVIAARLRIPSSARVTPYVELRPELGGGSRLVLTTGIVF
jgi:hypothetical protein